VGETGENHGEISAENNFLGAADWRIKKFTCKLIDLF
jgi:hypothetical protein